jgi:hypothetical protein
MTKKNSHFFVENDAITIFLGSVPILNCDSIFFLNISVILLKPCLHQRENFKYLLLPLAISIWRDRKPSIHITLLRKIAGQTSHVYISHVCPIYTCDVCPAIFLSGVIWMEGFLSHQIAITSGSNKYFKFSHWGLYHKTFYRRNLRIFVISYSVCPWLASLA